MYYSPTLRSKAQRQIKKVGTADLVIGLPTHKNSKMAAHVAQVALQGAHRHYPQLRTVLVNADAGHNPKTRRNVAAQVSNNGHNSITVITGRYSGLRGQGSATAALLDAALALDAKAIVILDSHTKSITPDWIPGLAHLLLENKADLVLPRYRQWLLPEGTLSDLIVYPLFRALWGKSIRHPATPDFAISPQLATVVLDRDVWGTDVAKFGMGPWLTTYATVKNWKIAQTALSQKSAYSAGEALRTDNRFMGRSKQTGKRFKKQFHDVLSTLFSRVRRYTEQWKAVSAIRSAPTLTRFGSAASSVTPADPDISQLLDNLALGWIEYRALWQDTMTTENLKRIETLAALPLDRFYFPSDLWAKIIYDFVVTFNKGVLDPSQIVEALFPIYQGRLAAFCQEVAGLAIVGREGTVSAQAVEFEEMRPYLIDRWESF